MMTYATLITLIRSLKDCDWLSIISNSSSTQVRRCWYQTPVCSPSDMVLVTALLGCIKP